VHHKADETYSDIIALSLYLNVSAIINFNHRDEDVPDFTQKDALYSIIQWAMEIVNIEFMQHLFNHQPEISISKLHASRIYLDQIVSEHFRLVPI